MKDSKKSILGLDFQGNKLNTLVENRKKFSLSDYELNMFETHARALREPLNFVHPVITHMLEGKKVMHLDTSPSSFEYLPGETLVFPEDGAMEIDFPEAALKNPTRCIALEIESGIFKKLMADFEILFKEDAGINTSNILLKSLPLKDIEVGNTIRRLVDIALGQKKGIDVLSNMVLKELFYRLLQSEAREVILKNYKNQLSTCKYSNVIKYINDNIHKRISIEELCRIAFISRTQFFTTFKTLFGVTPVQYISMRRMDLAWKLIRENNMSISNIAYKLGYKSINHFIRTFKQYKGCTPMTYKKLWMAKINEEKRIIDS